VFEEIGKIREHLVQGTSLFADAHHAGIEFAKSFRVFLQGGGERGPVFHRIGDLLQHLAQCWILLFFTEAFERRRNWNGGSQQRGHFAREGGDLLALHGRTDADASARALAFHVCRCRGVRSIAGDGQV